MPKRPVRVNVPKRSTKSSKNRDARWTDTSGIEVKTSEQVLAEQEAVRQAEKAKK